MIVRAVIVDDEPPARARLRHLLETVGGVSVVGEAASAVEARAVIRECRPDVLFLDIEMPEVHGTTLAASLPEPRPFIVFATAYHHYAIDAFSCEATDYLLKPVNRDTLAATLERIRQRMSRRSDTERDVATASALQAEMWPAALPHIPGFECAAASVPASGVGGDVYDVGALGPGTWSLLLGDVSGKGVAAGLVATALQGRVQTAARHAGLRPAALASAINDDVFASTNGHRYATMVYAELDAGRRRLRVVNAGHGGIMVSRPQGDGEAGPGSTAATLDPTGPALGLLEGASFQESVLDLPSGVVLALFTDGVTEASDADGIEFGMDRVAAILTSVRERPAAAQVAALLDAVREHCGPRPAHDDVTVMLVRSL